MKMNGILAPVIATLLAGSSAVWAQTAPSTPNKPPAATGTPAPSALPTAQEVRGTVKSVDQAKKRVTLDDRTMLTIPASVKVAPAALKKGAKISAKYEEKDGEKVVSSLRVDPPSKS